MFVLAIHTNGPVATRQEITEFLEQIAAGFALGADTGTAKDLNGREFAHFDYSPDTNPEVMAVQVRDNGSRVVNVRKSQRQTALDRLYAEMESGNRVN